MSAEPSPLHSGSAGSGAFSRRVPKAWNNARLYDLVEDMAKGLDALNAKVDRLMEHLGVPAGE